ncbi:MAG: endonuclease III [Phycisphaeraceae bacterium]|nr:endonuclease III [Phycisphaeraceae bacterium]
MTGIPDRATPRTAARRPSTASGRRRCHRGRARAEAILAALDERYPDARCALGFRTPHELLVATILSAQATDASVNRATPALFARFPRPADYAAATPQEIEPYIASIGLFRNKAKAIHAAMSRLCEHYGGEVPRSMADLLTLRGVARKTANVVLGTAFGLNEGVVVDTHVARLAQRFGLTTQTDPAGIETDLMRLFPRESWTRLSHMLIAHGRSVCRARGAGCGHDPLCLAWCRNAAVARKRGGGA